MKVNRAEAAAALAPALLLALGLSGTAGLIAATLEATERAALWPLVEPRIALVFMLWLVVSIVAGAAARRAWQRFAAAPGRLAEDLQVLLLASDGPRELHADTGIAGSSGSRALASAVNGLLRQRDALRADIASQVAEASRGIEQERNRLAALMAELTQSVVVCNLDGRVLLFNASARLQFRAIAGADTTGPAIGGVESQGLGLGRSIYAVLDRRLVVHALEAVRQRLQRGAAHPAAQFVTATVGGQLLRVQMTPVRAPVSVPVSAQGALPETPLNGFVLMLDNITRNLADDTERDSLLHRLTEGHRGSLGNLQAAVELLDDPALDSPTRDRFMTVVRDEIAAMSRNLNEAAAQGLRHIKSRWPLEDMLAADLVAAAARSIDALHGVRVTASDVDPQCWLKVDSYSLIQALLHLASRLVGEYGVRHLQLRLLESQGRAQLDLVWAALAMSTETVTAWETEAILSGDNSSPLTVRDVVERHGGAFWFERARVRQEAFFRILLPLAGGSAPLDHAAQLSAGGPAGGHTGGRPEFYDFDLFAHATEATTAQGDTPLRDLAYTVFDTETTGLEPVAGDEIIQIGATRIVAGKLRRQECFEQLVDPGRSVPAAGVAIHGIELAQLQGQPTIATVLPAFHAFALDTVLVAHNAAFDMRFLQLKEASTGLRFEQPVLDTLLLSEVIHPQQDSHGLDAIAERLGVPILGRHTALGDAIVTAEVFVKMLPLLHAQGITTLAQALAASRDTYLARLKY